MTSHPTDRPRAVGDASHPTDRPRAVGDASARRSEQPEAPTSAPVPRDPFETLGVEARFDLDARSLEDRHRALSKALHPDRYSGAPAAERRMALSRAIDVNEAFRLLRDPVRRAEALARRAGVPVGELAEPKAPPDLLMEMMELREELAEASAAKDLARVATLAGRMRRRQGETLAALARTFDEAAGDPQKMGRVLPALGELRYVRRFLDEVSAIEERLAP